MSDGLMVERKNFVDILVIEDDHNSKWAAFKAISKYANGGLSAETLADAKYVIDQMMGVGNDIDVILSDVHFPLEVGEEPVANVSAVLELCKTTGAALCFITKIDKSGMPGDGNIISLKATSPGRILKTELELPDGASEHEIFERLKTTESTFVRSASKTPEIWGMALQMALNARTKPTPVGRAVRAVKKLGLDVRAESGMLKVLPKK